MSDLRSSRNIDQKSSTNADQAEFSAVVQSSSIVDVGIFDDRIAGAGSIDDYDPESADEAMPRWQTADLTADLAVGDVQIEIERRIGLMGSAYPFTLSGNNIVYKPSSSGFYEFCLATSLAPSITSGSFVDFPRYFERAAANLVKRYFGENAIALHTGWPRDAEIGVRFKQAMRQLYERSGEWLWGPRDGLPDDPQTLNVKDEGVDYIVWLRSLDRRSGQLFLLGQCACGNDWPDKLTELSIKRFEKWFRKGSVLDPIRSFAPPFILGDGNYVHAHETGGMVFDRVRLSLLAEHLCSGDIVGGGTTQLMDVARTSAIPSFLKRSMKSVS